MREVVLTGDPIWNERSAMATASGTKPDLPVRTMPVTIGVCVLLAIAAFFLWQEHRAHLLGLLPYLLLAACPIVHLFMHRGHGGHRRDEGGRS
jgi:hypothetical protein